MIAVPNCSSLICPRIHNTELRYRVPASELSRDVAGHSWCNHCEKQLALMNWAGSQGWPSARVQGKMRYAIYGGTDDWFTSIAGANQDMIEALHETLIEGKRAPLPAIEH